MKLKLDMEGPVSGPDLFNLWDEEKMNKRMDIIGTNGNEGLHYGESGPLEFSHTPTPTPPCVAHAQASDELDEMEFIKETLGYAQEEGLLTEVVYFALKEMKADPTIPPSVALQFGYSEWIK